MSFIVVAVQEISHGLGQRQIGYDALAAFKMDGNLPSARLAIKTLDDYRATYPEQIFMLLEATQIDEADYLEDPEATPGLDYETEIRGLLK